MNAEAQSVYRALFCLLHQKEVPIATFENIPHWISPARALDAQARSYEKRFVYIPSGFFYSLSTPLPHDDELAAASMHARQCGASYLMYPCIRHSDDKEIFLKNEFRAFPWFMESVYRIRRNVAQDLRTQLGSPRWRDLQRLARKYSRDYEFEMYFGNDAVEFDWALNEFDRLHQKNLQKYGHSVNFYNRKILTLLFSSPLKKNLFICFSREKSTGTLVQALLGTIDREGGRMQFLVQGIDRAAVLPSHNIYASVFFLLFHWGEEHGMREFNFGRGKQMDKLHLGANLFYLLVNYVKNLNPETEADRELQMLSELASCKAESELQTLALAGGDKFSFPTSAK